MIPEREWCSVCEVHYDWDLEEHDITNEYTLGERLPVAIHCTAGGSRTTNRGPSKEDMEYVHKSLGVTDGT